MLRQTLQLTFAVFAIAFATECTHAASGTSIVATEGQEAYIQDNWPDGVAAVVNDPTRTEGWNPWFTEWPNDVHQYAFKIESTDDVNRLLEKLADVKSNVRQLRLSPLKEPESLGWSTRLPEDNGIAAVFSIGDQMQIDQWYGRVRKPFGTLNFKAAPVAVPPTLTLFVQNKAIDLDALKIPEGIDVSIGGVPTLFHDMNLEKDHAEEKSKEQSTADALELIKKQLDEPALKTYDRIETFLKKRQEAK
jgi:hypothetical protein